MNFCIWKMAIGPHTARMRNVSVTIIRMKRMISIVSFALLVCPDGYTAVIVNGTGSQIGRSVAEFDGGYSASMMILPVKEPLTKEPLPAAVTSFTVGL